MLGLPSSFISKILVWSYHEGLGYYGFVFHVRELFVNDIGFCRMTEVVSLMQTPLYSLQEFCDLNPAIVSSHFF